MTILAIVALGVTLFLGISILFGVFTARSDGVECRQCRHRNRSQARFCARCGTRLAD